MIGADYLMLVFNLHCFKSINMIEVNGTKYSRDFILSKMEAKSFLYNGAFLLERLWSDLQYFDIFFRKKDIIYCNGIPVGMLDNQGYFNYREPIIVC